MRVTRNQILWAQVLMRDILSDLERWRAQSETIGLATVIQTWGSSPRAAGAKMAFTPSGLITGSVSGGCIEGAVVEAGQQVLKTGRAQFLHFGVADETAWEVGLACGGSVDVLVQRLDSEIFEATRQLLHQEIPFATVTVTGPATELTGQQMVVSEAGPVTGDLLQWNEAAKAAAQTALASGQSQRAKVTQDDFTLELFIEVSLPALTLVIVGGVHIAIALATLAKTLHYRTIVVDPRRAFGNEARFPQVDQLIQAWPDEALQQIPLTRATAIAMLTHDPKLDDPALKVALPSPAFYVGALGSQTTQAKRRQRLLAEGLTEAQLNRLHGPIGLDLRARTPEEIALAILAEVVAARNRP